MTPDAQALPTGLPDVKPPANIAIMSMTVDAIRQVIDRPDPSAPNYAVLSGPPGFGKSTALTAAAMKTRSKYVEMPVIMRDRTILEKIGREYGLHKFPKRIPDLFDAVADLVGEADRPLMLDEFDRAVAGSDSERRKGPLEIIRALGDRTRVPILVAGEERLRFDLEKFETFHSRVLVWVQAPEASSDDVRKLAVHHAGSMTFADDLLEKFRFACRGNVRRITVNILNAITQASDENEMMLDLAWWNERHINNGKAPQRKLEFASR